MLPDMRSGLMWGDVMEQRSEPTGWVGWIFFAGVMLIIGGALTATYGFIAIVNDDWVVWGNTGAMFLDLTTWGWVHLVLGIVVLAAGFGVMTGNILARTVGVIVAAVAMIANFLALPIYPIWSIIIITISALVIWALTAHGREVRLD
jgi:hypothetical protein